MLELQGNMQQKFIQGLASYMTHTQTHIMRGGGKHNVAHSLTTHPTLDLIQQAIPPTHESFLFM